MKSKRKVRSVKGKTRGTPRSATPTSPSNKARNRPLMRRKANIDAMPEDQMLEAMRGD